MADNLDDVFSEPLVIPEAELVSQEPEPAPEPTPEAAAEPAPQPEVRSEPAADKGTATVPIAAMLDWRDKAQEAEKRLAAFESQKQPTPEPIDPFDDPAGFAAALEARVDARTNQVRFEMSDRFARQQHGAEATDAATTWAQDKAKADPVFAASYMREADPIGWIVQQHKRESDLQALGGMSLQDYIEAEIAKRTAGSPSAPAPALAAADLKPASPPVKVPRSLASQGTAPSDIRQTASGPLAGVDALFG